MNIHDFFLNLKHIHEPPEKQNNHIKETGQLHQTKKDIDKTKYNNLAELKDNHKTDNIDLEEMIQKQKDLEKEMECVSDILIETLEKTKESFLDMLQEQHAKVRKRMMAKQSKELENYESNGKNTTRLRKFNTHEILKEEAWDKNDQLKIKNQSDTCEQEIKKFTKIITQTFNETTSKLINISQKQQSENILMVKNKHKKLLPHIRNNKKIVYPLIISAIAVSVMFGYVNFEESNVEISDIKSSFVIQNLRGDTIDTWIAWKINDRNLNINLVNSPEITPERLKIVQDTLMSQKTLEIDDALMHKGPKGKTSTYYMGWSGALQSIQIDAKYPIPSDIVFGTTNSKSGDVLIHLTNDANADGYTAYTTAIADESNNQLLKASITVYSIDRLSDSDLATIIRHEMGHALGLAHSTDPDDLMHPVIGTDYPYISGCNIDAIISLYDGSQNNQVICKT
ncbi:MAG: matrixin family metalloprotease [Nitrosopumilus sp.]|uniref:matrixin family metalloprotease n=1 Tax=Nitrosopumilus sp. TaxID=2024843 RepID=UPI00247DF172|nr:matrixin family metalloprotease [Nitrosopumilus sp.]MCV0392043.1 matrixin family metalloprotease [Nitrosopumilus sp.]